MFITIVIGVLIALVLVIAFAMSGSKARHTSSRPVSRAKSRATMVAEITQLDLAPVARKVAERNGWDAARTAAAESDYRQFLTLIAENPRQMVSPWSKDLDLFWHEHILDTRRYEEDCTESSVA